MKMNSELKEEKKLATKGWDDKKKWLMHKAFKSRVEGLKDAVFESGSLKHAAQFTKTLEEIIDYIQIKYNSDVAMIRDMECPVFKFLQQSMAQIVTDANGIPIQEIFNKMEMYIWKNKYSLVHNQRAEFKKKEKRVFPIILGQCSPSLRTWGKVIPRCLWEEWHHQTIED